MIDKSIFKEYDIRGVVGEEFGEEDVYLIARAYGSVLVNKGLKVVCTNYDGRRTSKAFSGQLNKGLSECGLKVLDCGLGTSPMHYFAIAELKVDAGAMITASHNPKEYNGIKLNLAGNFPVFGEDVQKLIPIIESEDFVNGNGSIEEVYVEDKYVDRILKDLELKKDIKVVWDNGNGAAGDILTKLVAKMPGSHTVLYSEIDGNFPNHPADPSDHHNLKDLHNKVLEVGADVGFALDGDADRIGCITNEGKIIDNDILLAILAKEEIRKEPGGIVIADVKCSKVLFDKIAEYGGEPLMWKTGNVHAKAKMRETNALLAGEVSGHMFFNRGFYGHDDAIYAAIKILNILNNLDKSLDQMLDEYPVVSGIDEQRIEVIEEEKFNMVDKITKSFEAKPEFDLIEIDGVRATSDDGFILVRASNTQNLLSLRCESSKGEEGLDRLMDLLISELKNVGVDISKEVLLG